MSRTDAADAPLPTPRPSALTSLLADPDLTVTPEKPAPALRRRARKEVRFTAEDVEPDFVRRGDWRSSEGAGDSRQPGSSATASGTARVGDDDSDATTSAARPSRLPPPDGRPAAPAASADRSGSSAGGRRPVNARSRYSFPFTDPLDKENIAVTAAAGELAVPELNATLRVQRELEALRSRRINVDDELRQRLAGSHVMREQLKAKVYSKLNVREPVFGDMISTEVPKEQLLACAERSLVAKARATVKEAIGTQVPGQTKRAGDSSTAKLGSQDEASREGGNEDGCGATSGLRRFWSHRAMCFTGAATPDLYQYRFGCVEPSDGHAFSRTTQQQHLLDVYQHVCSWHM